MTVNRDEINAMLAKAEDKFKTARLNFESGQFDDAVSRAYYAVFHAISATLFSRGMHFSTHSQVIGNFNKEFVKTGIFQKDVTLMIQRLFDERQTGDYDFEVSIDSEAARIDIDNAAFIIDAIKRHLEIK